MSLIAFVILGALAVVSASAVILSRNPVISALSLAANLISIAGFYLMLGSQFIAVLQVIVYAGAIMVLVLFVIMLLNLPPEGRRKPGFFQAPLALTFGLAFVAIVAWVIVREELAPFGPVAAGFGTVGVLGNQLFTHFFYVFEAISLLLVVAMIGAVLLAKKRL
jgi:NADH-quinone oxidoreductase subunit J